jgi:hypothetical protein
VKPGYRFLISFLLGVGTASLIEVFMLPGDWPSLAYWVVTGAIAYIVARWTRACLDARYEDRP